MTEKEVIDAALERLAAWYDSERPVPGSEPERYVVCAGLAVLERVRDTFPLTHADYITEKSQVRTSGTLIKSILSRFGETRTYAREGGRTTRGTRPAAERWVNQLNAIAQIGDLTREGRGRLADTLQQWLAERVRDYFARRKIEVEIDLAKPAPQIIADILEAADARGLAGAVAQHLVGAKLAMRYPNRTIENFSYTTADQQLGRRGDFVLGDTVLHVTISPTPSHIEKCQSDLGQGYRTLLLVSDGIVAAARQMARTFGVETRVGVLPIESFVGQNLEELGEFGKVNLATGVRSLLETYNARVHAVETDRSLLIAIPENLG